MADLIAFSAASHKKPRERKPVKNFTVETSLVRVFRFEVAADTEDEAIATVERMTDEQVKQQGSFHGERRHYTRSC